MQTSHANYLTSSSLLTQTIERARTTLTYNGVTTGDNHDPVTASATLTRTDDGTPVGPSGKPVNITVGTQTCNTTRNTAGLAQCTIRVGDPAGATVATASFAGDSNYQPSDTTTPFAVTREHTALAYNGDTVILNGNTLHASAVLTEDDSTPCLRTHRIHDPEKVERLVERQRVGVRDVFGRRRRNVAVPAEMASGNAILETGSRNRVVNSSALAIDITHGPGTGFAHSLVHGECRPVKCAATVRRKGHSPTDTRWQSW